MRESPKCSHQSSGEAEDTVRRIESPTRIRDRDRVLREKFGRKVDSKSVASVTARHTGGAPSDREMK